MITKADDHCMESPVDQVPVCGIGASAGGIEALQQLFGALRDDLGFAYVVVIHLSPDYRSELRALLAQRTTMSVVEVGDHQQMALAANHVYVIAPDRTLQISGGSIAAAPFVQPRGKRTAIDLLFRSIAAAHTVGVAVVLSGTGSDGALGAKAIREQGGLVLVQDPTEATFGDMPQAVIATGAADVVLTLRELAARLTAFAGQRASLSAVTGVAEDSEQIADPEKHSLKKILELLHKRTGHDFAKYKRSTVLRRLAGRMQLCHRLTIADYLQHLRADGAEVHVLFNDLLISVTMFFRDPDAWAALQTQVIGPLVEAAGANEQVRVWVPGCATGEEAYSLAILFQEEFDRRNVAGNLIIFATDVDERALVSARAGLYPQSIEADVTGERLQRHFAKEGGHYRVVRGVRDRVVFAAHSLWRDPPFSRLQLVSCRNLLIYLDRDLQEQVMKVFRYAGRDGAYLFLGASETADEGLFQAIDTKLGIYVARPLAPSDRPALPAILAASRARAASYQPEARRESRMSSYEVHLAALEQCSAPSVVVDERGHVLHMSSSISRFFRQSGGPPAQRLTDLVEPDLRDVVQDLLHRAVEKAQTQLSSFVSMTMAGVVHRVAVLAQPRSPRGDDRGNVLVTFLDAGVAPSDNAAPIAPASKDEAVKLLRQELRESEQRFESMRDDQSLTTEDLRAANEELQSLNEEYRSTAEELETSREELQSINEELQTVNSELKVKLEEVSRTHSDLENFVAATDVATLFLDPQLRIKRFTPQLAQLFKVQPSDQGRSIGDLTHVLDYGEFEDDARRVLDSRTPLERETRSRSGKIYAARLRPYLTSNEQADGEAGPVDRDAKADGLVVTFIEVTAIKQAEIAVVASKRQVESELLALWRLHAMTMAVATAPNMQDAFEHILTAAMDLHSADFGSIRLHDARSGALTMAAQRGFKADYTERYRSLATSSETSCGVALRTRETCQIADLSAESGYPLDRGAGADAGFRALQSTPLLTRDGDIVGVLTVQFRLPHAFSERDKQLGEMLGRQVADLIESRTQQEHLVESRTQQERSSALMDSAPDAMIVTNVGGDIVLVNARAEALFGYSRKELLGQSVEALIPERFALQHLQYRKQYTQTPSVRGMNASREVTGKRKDGSEFPAEVSLSPVATADGIQIASSIRDISERRRAIEELRAARNEADKANRTKSAFLATASHDLRQPLQALAMLSGTLRRHAKTSQLTEALEQQEASIAAMSGLLNALLDIGKLESGAVKPQLADLDVAALLRDMALEFAELAASKRLRLEVETQPAWTRSDAALVGQVVRNLVSNAVKYTSKGRVVLRCVPDGANVRIEVLDTGKGIAADELPRIYEEFFQVGVPANAAREGYGLGLNIVRRIVDLLGLELTVQSEPDRGSMFSLSLPAMKKPAEPARARTPRAATRPAAKAGNSQRILLIEDDLAVLDSTRMLLRGEGYAVVTATSLAEAVTCAQNGPAPDLLITDYHLGRGGTGREVLAAVRKLCGAHLKAIVITGDTSLDVFGDESDPDSCVVSKPIDARRLLDLLASQLAG